MRVLMTNARASGNAGSISSMSLRVIGYTGGYTWHILARKRKGPFPVEA